MSRQVIGLRAGAVACVAAIGLLWWPASASAQAEAEVGWWYRLSGGTPEASSSSLSAEDAAPKSSAAQAPPTTLPPTAPFPTVPLPEDPPGAPAPVPPPATVPEGGMYIANDTFGPLAIGAVRFNVGQIGESRLTLAFADGSASAGLLPVVACPLLEGFQAVANGSWRDRPAHDCARAQALGTIGTDGSLAFVLSDAFQQAGQETLDVVLLAEPGNGTPFSVVFDTVSADALDVVGAAPDRTTPASTAFTPDPDAPAASFNETAADAGSGSSRSPARPSTGGSVTPAPAAGGSAAAPGAAPPAAPGAAQPVADVFDDRPWARWVATGILGALAVGLALASAGRFPGVAIATAGDMGVGRFARPREGAPPALT